jgi:hypothetical protein
MNREMKFGTMNITLVLMNSFTELFISLAESENQVGPEIVSLS